MRINRLFFFFIFIVSSYSQVFAETATSKEWLKAVKDRDTSKLGELIPAVHNINARTDKGLSALMAAAARGDTLVVQHLLENKAQVNLSNFRGGTALMYSAALNHLKTVDLLIEYGAEVNSRAENGWTALTLAAAKGNSEIVEKLLAAGAKPNIPDVFGWTALMRAIEHERYKSTVLLSGHRDIQINRINSKGQSALHIAATVNRCDLAQALVDNGADTQLQDFKGQSPLPISNCKLSLSRKRSNNH